MRRGMVVAAILGVLAASPAGEAAEPRWSAHLLQTPADSQTGGVGIDDRGVVTVLTFEGGRMVGRSRAAGQSAFSGPVDLGPAALEFRGIATPRSAQLAVADTGEVALLYPENVCAFASARSCTSRLFVRTGPSIRQLGAPELLTENGHNPTLDVAPDGHMAAGWVTAPDASGAMEVALRPPRGTFATARQRVGTETAPVAGDGPSRSAAGPSVSINTRGQAAAVWQQPTPAGLQVMAAYRGAGASFGAPEFVANTGYDNENVQARVTVDSSGGVLIALGGAAPALSWRPSAGRFGSPSPLPGAGFGAFPQVVSHADSQLVAWGRSSGPGATGAVQLMSRVVGAPFGPVRTVQLPGSGPGGLAADSRGNLHTVWIDGPNGAVRAATLDRLDLTPTEVSGRLTPSGPLASLLKVASNADGQVAGIVGIGVQRPDLGLDRAGVRLIERMPDAAAPTVRLQAAARRRGLVRAGVRCSESCLAGATVTATYRLKRKTRRPVTRSSRVRTIRRGRRHTFAVRLTRAERSRLRKLLRQHRAPRAHVTIAVEDSNGNRASTRRRVSLKSLLR